MKLRRVYPLFLVFLVFFMILPFTPLAHATLVNTVNVKTTCTLNVACNSSVTIGANNEIVVVEVVILNGCVPSTAGAVTDSFGNTYTFITGTGVSVPNGGGVNACLLALGAFSLNGGNDIIHLSAGANEPDMSINILAYSGFTGFGNTALFNSASSSGSDTRTINVNSQSLVIGGAIQDWNGACSNSITVGSSQQVLATFACQTSTPPQTSVTTSGITTSSQALSQGTYSDTLSWSGNPNNFGRFILELQTTTGASGVTQITQCYGNCGTPPVTLVNTNSTHPINFNQSITLFYEFQSNLNGFILNVTTNIGKTYTNGQQVSLAIYEATCNAGVTPFTISCPGQQQASLNGNVNPAKGQIVLKPATQQVFIGQWVAIAVTGVFSGLDLNDTNTNVPLFQQSGRIPQILSGASSASNLCSGCKMGLWAFVIGNTIVTGPPPSVVISCGADLVCFMVQSILALTPSNPLLGAIFYGIAFSIATIGALSFFSMKTEVSFPTGLYVLVFVAWMTFFASIVGAIWFVVLEILITILLFSSLFGTLVSGSFSGRGRSTA